MSSGDACCSGSSEPTLSVSSELEDEDLHQLQQTMNQTFARLTQSVAVTTCLKVSVVIETCT